MGRNDTYNSYVQKIIDHGKNEKFATKVAEKKDYSDIMDIHWEPKNHPRMQQKHRAKQFKPFLITSQKNQIIDNMKLNDNTTEINYEMELKFDEQDNLY